MTASLFLDSGIFTAFRNRRDQWHEQARAPFGGVRPRWYPSCLVVSETSSWFLHRHREEAARSFRMFLDSLAGLRIFAATGEHHRQVPRMLGRLRGARWTSVGASSLCWLGRSKIRKVWATGHPLGLTGAQVLPRS